MTDEEFISRFGSSPGRLEILRGFITQVGAARLRNMDERDLKRFWTDEVLKDPAQFNMNGGTFVGLASLRGGGPEGLVGADGVRKEPFLSRRIGSAGRDGTYELTDTGVLMLRALLAEQPQHPSPESTEEHRRRIFQLVHDAKKAVEDSNVLGNAEKKDLQGLLSSAEGILSMDRPSRSLLDRILEHGLARAAASQAVREIIDQLIEYVMHNWPF
ncbi:hypothetical protein [Mesorhizobium sp. 8]|uniref:hypothetical protein n=1 Tax=Mesorhizobium sp. 8 TaxID=2584466 RepID=UPI0011200719|nr:hypothetical protein [Mesorhizobium sp. 8]QDB99687.1 hypothetical protein FGU64_04295 [Mesorhizobium sp. 8]